MATEENFLKELKNADAIFFNGGNTHKLISTLQNYPNLKQIIEGKTVAGSSAGAYALATYGSAHSEKTLRKGLGLVPVRIICHYESPKLPPSKESLEFIKNTRPDLELVYLKDYEWKVLNL